MLSVCGDLIVHSMLLQDYLWKSTQFSAYISWNKPFLEVQPLWYVTNKPPAYVYNVYIMYGYNRTLGRVCVG